MFYMSSDFLKYYKKSKRSITYKKKSFVIEDIIGHTRHNKINWFRIKWLGYKKSTYQHENDLDDTIIHEYGQDTIKTDKLKSILIASSIVKNNNAKMYKSINLLLHANNIIQN